MNKLLPFLFMFLIMLSPAFAIGVQNDADGYSTTYSKAIYVTNGDNSLSSLASGYSVLFGVKNANSNYNLISDSYMIAQNFTEATNRTVRGAIVRINANAFDDSRAKNARVSLSIQTDSGSNTPSGTLVDANAFKTENVSDIWHGYSTYTYMGLHSFVFPANVTLVSGTKYWLVINVTDIGVDTALQVVYATASGYATGNMAYSSNGGTSWTGQTNYDLWFYVFQEGYTSSIFTYSGTTGTLAQNYGLVPTGSGNVVLEAGETLSWIGPSVDDGGAFVYMEYGGGRLTAKGNLTTPTTLIYGSKRRTSYGILMGKESKLFLDNTNISGNSTYVYTEVGSGANNRVFVRSNTWQNFYTGRMMYNGPDDIKSAYSIREFYNTTFIVNGTGYYSLYGAATYVGAWIFNGCNFYEQNEYASGLIYWRPYSLQGVLVIVDSYRNEVSIDIGDIQTAQSGGLVIFGHQVYPTIVNSTGSPVTNATVSVIPQFRFSDNPMYSATAQGNNLYATYGAVDYATWTTFRNFPSQVMSARTDTNGIPVDELGIKKLWMPHVLYANGTGTGGATIQYYFGGSNLNLRSLTDTTWANDGTDEGFIISVGSTVGGNLTIVNPSSAYTSNITLGSGGGTTSDYEFIYLPILLMVFIFIYIFYKMDNESGLFESPLKYLYAGLAIMFVWVVISSLYILAQNETAGITNVMAMIQTSYMWIAIAVTFIFLAIYIKFIVKNRNKEGE